MYSLITKENFYEKPEENDYDQAFYSLTEDFLASKLKTLICSPLGCVRDEVSLTHFAENIFKFQQSTSSSVVIVTYDEKTHSYIKKGLPHQEFVKRLKSAISQEYLQNCTKNMEKSLEESVEVDRSLHNTSVCSSVGASVVSFQGQFCESVENLSTRSEVFFKSPKNLYRANVIPNS